MRHYSALMRSQLEPIVLTSRAGGFTKMDTKQSKATELSADIRRTVEQLANETDAARQSELFRNYLKTSAAFWNYSWHNQMLIWPMALSRIDHDFAHIINHLK
jgi:hypothetical protein